MKDIKDMTTEELLREQIRLDARQVELNRQLRAIRFKKYPPAAQKIMRSLGWAPGQEDVVIRWTTGSFKAGK